MSARAKQIFEPLLGENAQWLPLAFDECEYWLLNSLRVLDALDLSQASVRHFTHGTGFTVEETEREMREAIELHIEGLIEDGLPIPQPSSIVEYLEVTT